MFVTEMVKQQSTRLKALNEKQLEKTENGPNATERQSIIVMWIQICL
jgi:hypothetical protein